MEKLSITIFLVIFLYTINRYWIRSLIEGYLTKKSPAKNIEDKKILNFVKDKSGLELSAIKLLDTKQIWGMMGGLPFMPYMVISKEAYKDFSKDEMQWLLLHEAGHYVLWHNVQMLLLQLSFVVIGIVILIKINLLLSPFLAILAVIFYTQLARGFEYQANYYALSKMDNPEGVKNMYKKAQMRWRGKGKHQDTLWERLFNVWLLDIYSDLIKKA